MSTSKVLAYCVVPARPPLLAVLLMAMALILPACVYVASVPGGGDTANEKVFKSADDLKARVTMLAAGMTEEDVFIALGAPRDAFTVIDPEDLWRIGLGRNVPPAVNAPGGRSAAMLTGYRLRYKAVTRQHGLASPIRIQTAENGFNYELTLIFSDGKLLEKPVLSGGMVSETRSRTLFDYVTPATALDRAIP